MTREEIAHVRAVAFLRNVNQGQRGHLPTPRILALFEQAGAVGVRAFQSNGTIVFAADDIAAVAERLRELLAAADRPEEVRVIPLEALWSIVAAAPAEHPAGRLELCLLDPAVALPAPPVAGRRCAGIAAGEGWMLVLNERDGESNGVPSLERLLGTRATGRGIPTLQRLLAAHPPA
ncbi:DUF1697 domain-containing protein [Microcella daejeonensis]|uniref:DUF1697 domain-containing protein n=1 Tax=Microcella daejeonensis TaxID=2994971 RepID=UPI00227174CF|nr:DUF1697 domain-containing protein [Microcella daejeonensis]WAB84762.1 DUF1697 domain-containing protein [Microcella daejeonensis]